jgi:hypothetical protein
MQEQSVSTNGGPRSLVGGQASGPVVEAPKSSHGVEVIVDNYRVAGELAVAGPPRRLVDIFNALDDIVSVKDATLDYPLFAHSEILGSPIAHIHMNTILFAIPHGEDVRYQDPFDKVTKRAIPCTIVVPGFEITGNIWMVAEIDPTESHILTTLHFVPLTDVRVLSLINPEKVWEADVLVVNLTRAVVYAPHSQARSEATAATAAA